MPPQPFDPPGGPECVDVAVVGGGIAGLSVAYQLIAHAPWLICALFEASPRLGGKVLTETIDLDDGRFVVEAGPDAFLAQKPWARQLAEELGLADRIVPITTVPQPVSILKHGRPIPLPEGVSLLAPTRFGPFVRSPLLSPRGKARTALDLILPASPCDADESLGALVRRRLGEEALDWIAEPLMAGIYNGDPDRLSLLATFPTFRAIERDHGSLIRGLRAAARAARDKPRGPAFLTLRGGMQELTDALASRVAGIAYRDASVEAVCRTPDGAFTLAFAGRSPVVARRLVLTVPTADAATLLMGIAPRAADGLARLHTIGAGSVSLAYRPGDVKRPLPGYGLVVPRREERPINAITVASRKFEGRAPGGWQLLRVFFGGARSTTSLFMDEDRLIEVIRGELCDLLGIESPPAFHRLHRWSSGSPRYDVGHLDRIAAIEAELPPGVFVTGGAYRGVGLPDIVRAATTVAERIIGERPDTPHGAVSAVLSNGSRLKPTHRANVKSASADLC
jgi:oxygen-dependent protoporphyrinogen oxidase